MLNYLYLALHTGNPYIRPIANVTAVAGTTVVVHCRVAGYPITLIRWLKNSLTLPLNIRQTVLSNGTMIIRDVTKRPDEGLYSCRASNNQGIMATKMFHLTVQIPPEIAPFSNVTLTQGERTQLLCTVNRGDTPMNITWYKDGEDIPPGHGIQIHYTEFSSTLGIADASVSHEGSYTCEAQNHAASATFTGYLTVNGKLI
ncbi:putative Down syndrome cell adhesion molecule-like [Apostichopus japonicus]|uniref:Putative Down syndrome cell adhesion molecule-like n=1 Tax=Stichopus japonicus TaxID=307972 RepID=A0A2G8L301_STIJA|nr:putative Down syndrome cell adhesion molecule-like [Apostichopus japonicus]